MTESNEVAVDGANWYVYGLVDPIVYRRTGSQLLSIFYVGKGTKDRAEHHEEDEMKSLADNHVVQREASKKERIDQILGCGERIWSITLASGFDSEKSAYKAESLAMELIGRLLTAHNQDPLTNAIPGHGQSQGMEVSKTGMTVIEPTSRGSAGKAKSVPDEPEYEWRSVTESLRLSTSQRIDVSELIHVPTILVKGTYESMTTSSHQVDPSPVPGFESVADRIKPMLWSSQPGTECERRPYDPDDPWTDHEARERAQRYWPISEELVKQWLTVPESMPRHLLLAIPGQAGTTVRYAWEVDPAGLWERFREHDPRWGIPLGNPLLDHPARGACLTESRNGKPTQVLANYSSGIRIFLLDT